MTIKATRLKAGEGKGYAVHPTHSLMETTGALTAHHFSGLYWNGRDIPAGEGRAEAAGYMEVYAPDSTVYAWAAPLDADGRFRRGVPSLAVAKLVYSAALAILTDGAPLIPDSPALSPALRTAIAEVWERTADRDAAMRLLGFAVQ